MYRLLCGELFIVGGNGGRESTCKGNNVAVLEEEHGSFDYGGSRENGVKFLLG